MTEQAASPINAPGLPPAPEAVPAEYAGFWNRAIALFLDYTLISTLLFPFIVAMSYIAPNSVVVSVPFGLFTSRQVLDSKPSTRHNKDGSTTIVDTDIVQVTALGKWTYLYREETSHTGGEKEKSSQLIDPKTRRDIETTTPDDIIFWVLLVYWIAMESSPWQASVGKMLMGIYVTDSEGRRLTVRRALGRNAGKIVSLATLCIGFMIAGWTTKKQALHDYMSSCYVCLGRVDPMPARSRR